MLFPSLSLPRWAPLTAHLELCGSLPMCAPPPAFPHSVPFILATRPPNQLLSPIEGSLQWIPVPREESSNSQPGFDVSSRCGLSSQLAFSVLLTLVRLVSARLPSHLCHWLLGSWAILISQVFGVFFLFQSLSSSKISFQACPDPSIEAGTSHLLLLLGFRKSGIQVLGHCQDALLLHVLCHSLLVSSILSLKVGAYFTWWVK